MAKEKIIMEEEYVVLHIGRKRAHECLISKEDYDRVCQFTWYVKATHGKHYAFRQFIHPETGKKVAVYMHRYIMNPPDDMQVDHINGNAIDNRRENLRVCTHAENQWNAESNVKGKTSKYKGVSILRKTGMWTAQICFNKEHEYLGQFRNEHDAAEAYNAAAVRLHGKFAKLNIIERGD